MSQLLTAWFFQCSVSFSKANPIRAQRQSYCILQFPTSIMKGFSGGLVVKNLPAMQETCRRHGFDPWVGKIPWRRKQQLTPVFLPGESHGQRSLAGYCPWGRKEVDMSKQLSTHTHTHTSIRKVTVIKPKMTLTEVLRFTNEANVHYPSPNITEPITHICRTAYSMISLYHISPTNRYSV